MIKIDDTYSLYHDPPSPSYPGGSAIDTPEDDNVEGTGIFADWFNDIEGFFQSIIVDGEGSFTVSGLPEKVGASDLLTALKKIIAARIAAIETPAAVLQKILSVDGAGSGLDADFLDGEHGSAFHNASNLTAGTLPAARMPAFTGEVTSSVGTVALSLDEAAVKLKAWPVNSLYVQYADTAANVFATAFPAANRPAALFGGTWTMQWEDSDNVFWRSGGSLGVEAETDRINGLQGDAIRNMVGKFGIQVAGANELATVDGGLFRLSSGMGVESTGSPTSGSAIAFDPSNIVPTAHENRPINRRIIIWKRTA